MDTPVLPFRQAPPAYWQKYASGTTATSAVNGTFTTIAFAANSANNGLGIVDSPNTTQLRALVAGTYRIRHNVSILCTVNNKAFEARILKNGTTPVPESRTTCTCANATEDALTQDLLVDLAVNETVEIQVAPINATAGTAQINSSFSIELVKFN